MFTDTHCHLSYQQFQQYFQEITTDPTYYSIDNLIMRAKQHDVTKMLFVSTSPQDIEIAVKTANKYDGIFSAIGLHPSNIDEDFHNNIQAHQRFLIDIYNQDRGETPQSDSTISQQPYRTTKIIAIGEIGFDLHYENANINYQIDFFEMQKEIAAQFQLPIIIHSRNADEHTLKHCQHSYHTLIHCFCGDIDFAKKLLDSGCFLSFSGIVTYKKNHELREVIRYTPLDRIFIETDAPFLAPMPHRGKINEPAFISEIAKVVCDAHNISILEFCNQMEKNWEKSFVK